MIIETQADSTVHYYRDSLPRPTCGMASKRRYATFRSASSILPRDALWRFYVIRCHLVTFDVRDLGCRLPFATP
jgi:hypothetical protein